MLIEMALGDAWGAGFEFAAPEFVAANNFPGDASFPYQAHPKGTIPAGCYTDDTQMTIGLVEFLLSSEPMSTIRLARSFLHAFKRDPRYGYSAQLYDILKEAKNGTDLLTKIWPFSRKCGGAMRAAPCGLLVGLSEAIDLAMWQASLTHATADGMQAAAAIAMMVWGSRRGTLAAALPSLLDKHTPISGGWGGEWSGPVPTDGIPLVQAVLTTLQKSFTMTELLQRSVAWTGDVDTVAALAMAIASVSPHIQNDLPKHLIQGLEPGGRFGLKFLAELDVRLSKQFQIPR